MRGDKQVAAALKAELIKFRGKIGLGLIGATTAIKLESQLRTPVDTGRLKASTFSNQPKFNQNEIITSVGTDTNYAVFVHENLESSHITGESKFLFNAIISTKSATEQIMASELRL
jgi:hypothetical protein